MIFDGSKFSKCVYITQIFDNSKIDVCLKKKFLFQITYFRKFIIFSEITFFPVRAYFFFKVVITISGFEKRIFLKLLLLA